MDGTPFGRYRLLELLGRGGMGEVWRAFDTATNRVVAVKVLPANLASDPTFEQRFRREAFAAASLADPHVVPIHNFGEIEGRLYVDMRLIEGSDLQTILRDGPLEPGRAVGVVEQVASALNAAHRIGLVHRDVKPSNILVAEDDFAYLIDFGIARAAGETGLTGTGNVIGTWAYLAPERLTSAQTDSRSDIYALACVLHECLTGNQPFPGGSVEQQIAGHLSMPPPKPSLLRRGVPAQMDPVLAKGMAKNPDERYSTTRELAKDARAALTVAPTRPDSVPPADLERTVQNQPTPPTQPAWAPNYSAPASNYPAPASNYPAPPISYPPLGSSPPAPPGGGPVSIPPTPYTAPPPASIPSFPPPAPKKSGKKSLAIAGIIIVVVAALAVGGFVLYNKLHRSTTSASGADSYNSGPFTGVFSVEYGPSLNLATGEPYANSSSDTGQYALRSICRESRCLATATRLASANMAAASMIFDDIDGQWVGVRNQQSKCRDIDVEEWTVISLQPRPDGTLSGELRVTDAQGCASKRVVTFKRIRDVTPADGVEDPANVPARTKSPAMALHGLYHSERTYTMGAKQEGDYNVQTACVRTGERCISFFYSADGFNQPLAFANEKWTRSDESDTNCKNGAGTVHIKQSAEFPLPEPAQEPITLLSGTGHQDEQGTACPNAFDYTQKFTRLSN